jgi:hypothetical protein
MANTLFEMTKPGSDYARGAESAVADLIRKGVMFEDVMDALNSYADAIQVGYTNGTLTLSTDHHLSRKDYREVRSFIHGYIDAAIAAHIAETEKRAIRRATFGPVVVLNARKVAEED